MEDHKCADGFFRCHSGQCIAGNLKCNNISECEDGSDELNCTRPPTTCDKLTHFDCTGDGTSCIKLDAVCNQIPDCAAAEDETDTVCSNMSKYPLALGYFCF